MKKNKKKILFTITGTTIVFFLILYGCSTPEKAKSNGMQKVQQKKKNPTVEEVQNFNYLFIEALKQKMEGNYQLALKYFNGCMQINPDDDAVNYQLSQIWAMAGKDSLAKKYGWKAIREDPDNIYYYYQLAQIYQQLNNMDTVKLIYKKMIQQFPERIELKNSMAQLYSETGDYKHALEIYNSLVRKYGYNLQLGLFIEEIYENMDQLEKAEAETEKLMEKYPDNLTVMGIRAELFSKMGKLVEAERLYRQLMNTYGDNETILMSYVEHKIRAKEKDSLGILLSKIFVNTELSDVQKVSFASGLLMNVKGNKDIEGIIKEKTLKWITGDSVSFQAKASYTDYLIKENDDSNAMVLLKNITEERPDIIAAWQQLGIVEQKMGEVDSLIQDMNLAIEYNPKDPILYLLGASGLLQADRNEEAVEMLDAGLVYIEEANVSKPLKVQYYGMLGDAYNAVKEFKNSERYYDKALDLDPENTIILNNYGYYLALRKKRLNDALSMSQKTLDKEPDNPTYLDTNGWILFQMGKFREAEKKIKKALENEKEQSAEVYEHYGDVLQALDRTKEAMSYWKKALLLDPGNHTLEEKLKLENED